MPTPHEHDRFDDLPRTLDRVGAHRAPARKGRGWVSFWWALAATVVLIGIGVAVLYGLNSKLSFSPGGSKSPSASAPATPKPVPTAAPTVDPSLDVTVLNGTPGEGVAKAVSETLETAGWKAPSASNADTEDVPKTIVYFSDPKLEGAARGVAQSLPGSTVLLSKDFAGSSASLTVVVGNDYVAPVD